ncbi:sensor domain-containing diguanylate cyclase [Tsukamurella spumae]|uniref:Sensor domain-containing diguanylate cyclase n=1 Tax=Tsukamurella spumae TaxID=44753 RepID=A0A846X8C4_9ACTN|nr:sensor domain-containing diguanylate cyclase [Tsukamurella spumae]NKY20529.1 sensor domain-containing diguanylate cyclase [Tsukamurella spumae]
MPHSSSPLGFLARGESVVALLVDEFLMAIADDVYLPLPVSTVRAELLTAFQRMISALGADEFDPAVGRDVGSLLVSLQITAPEGAAAGGRAIAALPDALSREPSAEARRRSALILAEYAAGYAEALTGRIIDGQAVVHRATQRARRSAEEGERQAEARLRMMFDHARLAVFVADEQGVVLSASPIMRDLIEANRARMGGAGEDVILPLLSDDPDEVARALRTLALVDEEKATVFLEAHGVLIGDRRGVVRWATSRTPVREGSPAMIVGVGHDVTELHARQVTLDHLAHHDALTGLPNRRSLTADLQSLPAPAGFCLIDLDGFKRINDQLGHSGGDALLAAVARRMEEALGGTGRLYRVGGDEFAVLVASPFQPRDVAQLVHRTLRRPIEVIDGPPIAIGASIGTTVASAATSTVEGLIAAADTGLYRSKEARRA